MIEVDDASFGIQSAAVGLCGVVSKIAVRGANIRRIFAAVDRSALTVGARVVVKRAAEHRYHGAVGQYRAAVFSAELKVNLLSVTESDLLPMSQIAPPPSATEAFLVNVERVMLIGDPSPCKIAPPSPCATL